ncbi:TetR family transcriptional regulator [Plantibacter sp. YIM 135249]|uniref:TetR/AcrR family transcriptional regulator n=1 Tax=Plantibacter sp. YIM 135249 TaxID=3423918 RepID=UPI003D338C18
MDIQETDPAPRTTPSGRAAPMPADDRRAMIAAAVVPLLLEHGRDITTKQIAEAAGVAEGTLFRAFGDKEAIIRAAIVAYLDPEPLRKELRSIDQEWPVERQIRTMLIALRERFRGVFRIMSAGEHSGPPPGREARMEFATIIESVLEPHRDQLNWPPVRVAHIARLLAFASSVEPLNEGTEFDDDELTAIFLYGVVGTPPSSDTSSVLPASSVPVPSNTASPGTASPGTAPTGTAPPSTAPPSTAQPSDVASNTAPLVTRIDREFV